MQMMLNEKHSGIIGSIDKSLKDAFSLTYNKIT